MKEESIKRLKTWAFNFGYVALVAGLNAATTNLGVLELPEWGTLALGLALSQLSKYLANKKLGKVS
mgnify:CR=1 FL=1